MEIGCWRWTAGGGGDAQDSVDGFLHELILNLNYFNKYIFRNAWRVSNYFLRNLLFLKVLLPFCLK